MRRRLGDRRGRPRFDIVGDLPGSLEAVLHLPLKDVSRGGALIHSHVPLPAESVHTLRVDAPGHSLTTRVKVKHVTDVMTSDGERMYLVGVEFVAMHPVLLRMIEGLEAVSGEGHVADV